MTEISLEIMLYIMINNGAGLSQLKIVFQSEFYEKLIIYYESNDSADLKKWLYDNYIDGMNL